MSFAKILAPLTGGPRDPIVLAGAFSAAQPFAAHVEALFIRPDPVEAMPFYGEGISSAVVQEIVDVSKDAAARASQAAREALTAAAGSWGGEVLATAERRQTLTASFREVQGHFADQIKLSARLADLIVFGPLKEGDRPGLAEAFEATLIETGRPVLLVSRPPNPQFAQKIAVTWNGSLASAHAVTAALPFLKAAATVEVLVVKRPNAEPIATDDLRQYLRLHRVVASERTLEASDRPVADVLLEAATQGGAGMLVAGGYGRNRLREMFVVGTTRRVIANAALPCFLVH